MDTVPIMTEVMRVFDPLLETRVGDPVKYSLFPIQHQDVYEMYKQAVASYWVVEEVDLSKDKADYDRLSSAEQNFVKHVLAFFAVSDAIVNENLATNFSEEVVAQEAKSFYAIQQAMEAIHGECYSLLIDTLISDQTEKADLFNAVATMPAVAVKAAFMQKYMTRRNSFEERLVAFACAEGILFSSSFAAIYFFKKSNLMPGLSMSNLMISRDEGLHAKFACLLYSKLRNKLSMERVQEIVTEAVRVERDFVQSALSQDILGINADEMMQYVQMIADRLLVDLGSDKIFGSKNPFLWMNSICLQGNTNFFELRNDSYSKANVGASAEECVFDTECDF